VNWEARPDPSKVSFGIRDGVAEIRMIDEDGKNGLGMELISALLAALNDVAVDANVRTAVIFGNKDIFCSGATRSLLNAVRDSRIPPAELVLARRLLDSPVPIIGAAQGAAVGGGLALLFACDLVVLAAEQRYGANFFALGITPGMGVTALLEHAMSPALAHELLYTASFRRGRDLTGVSRVVPSYDVEHVALDLALQIAAHDRNNIRLLKRALTLPRRRALEEAFTVEALMHETTINSMDLREFHGGDT
jgi:enoyl-CoA hydratase/carnithine racemase